ncbi:MAG: hypothetical protein E5Y88_19310 [Mesorhizobium sp.]|uniref:hypothetical protein n=1 Tax=Mesorhizobium sp. TaxID=1871066 RepID=UPI000FE92E09|nr:hypothetical protein [Mesorhizobium sp.]RWQ39890.1 MAG: hypothetical protein EOS20_04755 [Mesorhizobium sp.]TIL24031.1 MAG: hypothetical protein E5Y88_19310 [Mesorhizobium sp.]
MQNSTGAMRAIFCSAGLSLAIVAGLGGAVSAQSAYTPTNDVDMILSYAPGGGLDLFARKVIDIIREEKLAPITIKPENRSGGSGAVGWGWVWSSARSASTSRAV